MIYKVSILDESGPSSTILRARPRPGIRNDPSSYVGCVTGCFVLLSIGPAPVRPMLVRKLVVRV